jgi:FdhD protein
MNATSHNAVAPQLDPDSPLFGLGYAEPVQRRSYVRYVDGGIDIQHGMIAEEVPVAVVYNAQAHAVMMATPADLEDFATGFTISEGIAHSLDEIRDVQVVRHAQGIELQIQITAAAAERRAARARNLVGRTSCGLCGVESIAEVLKDLEPVQSPGYFDMKTVLDVVAALPERQQWNRETATLHAAAWASSDGEIAFVREDVGRHNALDKVTGALQRTGREARQGFVVLTSRASYELVQKTAIAGVALMAAVSRPTGLAIRLAEAAGMALVGLARDGTANIYADPRYLLNTSTAAAQND